MISLITRTSIALLLAALCGCTSTFRYEQGLGVVNITRDGSDWKAEEIQTVLTPVMGGYVLEVNSIATEPAQTLLLELEFTEQWQAFEVTQRCAEGEVNLVANARPGVLGLGVIMAEDQQLAPGPLLTCRLVPARGVAAVASPDDAPVSDLAATRDSSAISLSWSYRLTGDFDQNSEVNIADLTPLGTRLGASTTDGSGDEYDAVVDGDSNTEVNLADITAIGANYRNRLTGYRCFSADGPDLQTATSTEQSSVDYGAGTQADGQSLRRYSTDLTESTALAAEYFYVVPMSENDTPLDPSNVAHSPLPVDLTFELPPAGNSVIDDLGGAPSLALLEGSTSAAAGAPLIAYTTGSSGNRLQLAHYNDGAWVSTEVDTRTYSLPQLVTAGGRRQIVAFDIGATELVLLSFDENWQLTGSETIAPGLILPTQIRVDVNPDGELGVATAYRGGSGAQMDFAQQDGTTWTSDTLYQGSDTISGLAFRYHPTSGVLWLLFTHGTANFQTGLELNFALERAGFDGVDWTLTPIAYPGEPLRVDLSFTEGGNPLLAMSAGQNYEIPIPLNPIDAPLIFAGVAGEYDGAQWQFNEFFSEEPSFSLIGGFPPTAVNIELMLAYDVAWAKANEVLYNVGDGEIEVDINTFVPQDGSFANTCRYAAGTGTSLSDNSYFTGIAGMLFSWDEIAGNHGAAYMNSADISSDALLTGDFSGEAELLYWRP